MEQKYVGIGRGWLNIIFYRDQDSCFRVIVEMTNRRTKSRDRERNRGSQRPPGRESHRRRSRSRSSSGSTRSIRKKRRREKSRSVSKDKEGSSQEDNLPNIKETSDSEEVKFKLFK